MNNEYVPAGSGLPPSSIGCCGEERRFVRTQSPHFVERNDSAPDFALLAGLRILRVGPAIDKRDLIPIDRGVNRLVWTNAPFFLLRIQRRNEKDESWQ
jgi:hypothetical protein